MQVRSSGARVACVATMHDDASVHRMLLGHVSAKTYTALDACIHTAYPCAKSMFSARARPLRAFALAARLFAMPGSDHPDVS